MKKWIKAALIRAVKTICQTAVATLSTNAAFTEINWSVVFYTSALAGLLSILTSFAGLPEVEKEEEDEK